MAVTARSILARLMACSLLLHEDDLVVVEVLSEFSCSKAMVK